MNDSNFNPNSLLVERSVKPNQSQIDKFKRLNRNNVALYSVISTEPPIFYVPRLINSYAEFQTSYQLLFDYLKDVKSYFFCSWWGYAETTEIVGAIKNHELELNRIYPTLTFVHLCNTARQTEVFLENRLNAIFCNHNCLVDENIFKPLPFALKKFDAVYDARFVPWKRHYLAAQISSLALIYYFVPSEDDFAYIEEVKRQFTRAHFFNRDKAGNYQSLSAIEVNQAINACRTGLCLSENEGAMYASVQYLLAGLPVVTTTSVGGRDVFFDSRYVLTVEANAGAVKNAVGELLGRNVDPYFIRANTLKTIETHRRNFILSVQDIYAAEQVSRDFGLEWNKIFFNKLLKYQNHKTIIGAYFNHKFNV